MTALRLAYLANVLILLPIAIPTLLRLFDTSQGRFHESAGWRMLVGALWTSILVASLLGLSSPLIWSPVLVLQVIYKSLWLGCYVLQRLRRGDPRSVPPGLAVSFVAIVLIWPWVIPWGYLWASDGVHAP